jgi:hypothetical protein
MSTSKPPKPVTGSFIHPSGKELPEFREALDYIYKFESCLGSEQQAQGWTPPQLDEGHKGRYLWTDGSAIPIDAKSSFS